MMSMLCLALAFAIVGASVDLDAFFQAQLVSATEQGMAATAMADRNSSQALTVVQNLTIQAQGDLSSNPALFGALATSARVPDSGAVPKA